MRTASKGAGVVLRIALILALLSTMVVLAVQPVSAAADVEQGRYPIPTGFVLNLGDPGTGTEYFWWSVEYDTTPLKVTFEVFGPGIAGPLVHSEEWNYPADGIPDFNPESIVTTTVAADPPPTASSFTGTDATGFPLSGNKLIIGGADFGAYTRSGNIFTILIPDAIPNAGATVSAGLNYGNHTFPANAHQWVVPAGSDPGTYYSYVRYYSVEVGFESGAEQTFWVEQPLQIFKYNDLEGNGVYEKGKVAADPAPTDTTLTAEGLSLEFPVSGDALLISGIDFGAFTRTGNNFTFTGLGFAPTAGEIVSVNPGLDTWAFSVAGPAGSGYTFNGFTSGGGFLDLPLITVAGDYTFTETLQNGWRSTDPGGSSPYTKVVTISDDIEDPTNPVVYFGNQELGGLEIFKFNDLDQDGIYDPGDGESPLNNWHYTITGPGGYNSSGTTDGSGLVTKNNLVPGDYTVTETTQPDWTVTTPNPQTHAVLEGETYRFEFGNFQQLGTLIVFKFNDLNSNGIYDGSDYPLSNWHFDITGPGGYASSGITSGGGTFTKTGLTPGDYSVTEIPQGGWVLTTGYNPLTLPVFAGGVATTFEFGNHQPPDVPGVSTTGILAAVLAFAAAMALLGVLRTRRTAK